MNLSRRRTLLGLGALAAGAGLVSGSGAFDSVESEREVSVEFTADSEAVLTMRPARGGDGDFVEVEENENGEIGIEILRINRNARTVVDDIVEFTNNGTQPIESITATIDDESENASLEVHTNLEDVSLDVGESAVGLGFTIDTLPPAHVGDPSVGGVITIHSSTVPDGSG